ncbi:S9 family peptidase [Olivibacter sitiensis]|uniref:S9 family peptidase n=1 Tax=Olivibacter sitiensis TaxID=376470 RepID=UPI000427F035|nr:prolyl oligopeptidase family serine peptidase [Olivibacter sitiensis]
MRKLFIIASLFFVYNLSTAQKKPLDHQVYDNWQNIQSPEISKDGKYIGYAITPQQGDAILYIVTPQGEQLWNIPRAENISFSYNSAYSAFLIKPPYAEVREARIKKKKPEEMPKDSLGIISFATGEVLKKANAKSFKLPEENGDYLAYLIDEAPEKDTSTKDSTSKKAPSKPKKGKGATLYLRYLASGEEEKFEDVDNYDFSKTGKRLAFSRTGKDSLDDKAGLYIYELNDKQLKQISKGKGTYKQFTFDEAGDQFAFIAEKSPEKALWKPYSLYYYTALSDTATIVGQAGSTGMPNNWNVSGDGDLRFSKNGEKLFFGIAPIPRVKDTTIVDFEVANVDVWHYQDDYLQPQQLVNLKRDLSRSYLSVIYPAKNSRIIPLANLEVPDTYVTKDADNEFVLASSNEGRRIATQWDTNSFYDVYLVSTIDGSRRKIVDNLKGNALLSPEGNYVMWFDLNTQRWHSYDIKSGVNIVLTQDLPVNFGNEENDTPAEARPYGIAGWTPGDKQVFIYDRYDIWSFDPKGKNRKIVTNGAGRAQGITFRYQDVDNKESGRRAFRSSPVIEGKELLLSAFNNKNKYSGWYKGQLNREKDPQEIVMGPYSYRQIKANDGAKWYIYSKESYVESPDLFVSQDLKSETQLSHTNPQQANYNWGTAELVQWTTPKGYQATGILYKPEDFDANKQYPVIAYFYETLSDGLYSYIAPAPTPSRLNISYFVSNGYLVFAPDIHYEIGHPGQSAEEYINSGMAVLSKQPWVDEKHLGIQGQSWGGYQVAHLITRTNMYAAAWAGAPVVNMTSAYGGIRWQSGMNRQFQYEKTQSRIGQNLWDGYDLYVENSPLFHLKNVNTPVVIMANDNDGAVPWYQGIEMFTALRRLGKPAWMLNYNGEEHNLVKRQNRKDIQIREQQFFDHFLKGKPAPVWLQKGIPATLKGIDWGFDLVD